MLGRPVLGNCVRSGSQMWPELAQKNMWLAHLPALIPALSPMMPVENLLPSFESPAPPLHPLEALCCLFHPYPTLRS